MPFAGAPRLLRSSLLSMALCLFLSGAGRADPAPDAGVPAAPRLRIKNAQSIRVALSNRRHEPASALRPDKGLWNVIMASAVEKASAELVDLTPNAPRSRWVVEVQGDKVVLDGRRFLPTHVYQMDVRQERRLVGTALVYLYPAPAEKGAEHVEFKDEESGKKGDSGGLTSVPKGDL
jgi:hypothetical protein